MLSVQCDLNKTRQTYRKGCITVCVSAAAVLSFTAIRNSQESVDSCRKTNEVLYFRQLQNNLGKTLDKRNQYKKVWTWVPTSSCKRFLFLFLSPWWHYCTWYRLSLPKKWFQARLQILKKQNKKINKTKQKQIKKRRRLFGLTFQEADSRIFFSSFHFLSLWWH